MSKNKYKDKRPVNIAANVPACLADDQGFEAPTGRHDIHRQIAECKAVVAAWPEWMKVLAYAPAWHSGKASSND